MPVVSTVSVWPTWTVPPMVGAPVAVRLGAAATAVVASLVSVSALSRVVSEGDTRTWKVLPLLGWQLRCRWSRWLSGYVGVVVPVAPVTHW